MTSLMAAKIGGSGRVQSFEPHPDIFAKLCKNVDRWQAEESRCTLSISPTAMSSRNGVATLRIPDGFEANEGLASLERYGGHIGIEVPIRRLDNIVMEKKIALMKIDVEGHELQVLLGAGSMITNHQVRDILFEEEAVYPTETTSYLERHGYKIYGLGMRFSGPIIADAPLINKVPRRAWEPRSLLATCVEDRAKERLRLRGWSVLHL